jgi:hypothetical protein
MTANRWTRATASSARRSLSPYAALALPREADRTLGAPNSRKKATDPRNVARGAASRREAATLLRYPAVRVRLQPP